MLTHIRHKDWNGEIGNCISTPDHRFMIGTKSFISDVVMAIVLEHGDGIKTFNVYWKRR